MNMKAVLRAEYLRVLSVWCCTKEGQGKQNNEKATEVMYKR